MDRVEAYSILNSELNLFSGYSLEELEIMEGEEIETEITTNEGTMYSLSFKVEKSQNRVISVKGSIHDNNSFKFELLEESLTLSR
tara:strand:- start:54 stop:308 length:255 start_codon:yes stop_codon:yes gene_type:complete